MFSGDFALADMDKYILFIDTETSDKPREWKAPTAQVDKWPYLLQVSWAVYEFTGKFVIKRNFYINPGEIIIHKDSLQLHGISLDFLKNNGIQRKEVLQQLSNDLEKFSPFIVGHFLKFDLKMLEVGFNRIGIDQDLLPFTKFCTMQHTRHFLKDTSTRYLRLNELYQKLFSKELANQHDATVDVDATKDCFFELLKQGDITENVIERQQKLFIPKKKIKWMNRFHILLIIAISVLLLLFISKFSIYTR